MKDSRNEKYKERAIGSVSNKGIALYAGTTAAGIAGASFLTRNTAVGSALVNSILPTTTYAAEAIGALEIVASIGKLIATQKGRNRNKRIIKNMAQVKSFANLRVLENGLENTSIDGVNADAKRNAHDRFVATLDRESEYMYSEILRDRICNNPNRLQQEVLNTLNFREYKTDTFDGESLPETVDYSLSTVYNILRLKSILDSDKPNSESKEEAAKIQKQLGHLGMGDLTSEEIKNVLEGIDNYLEPLKPLYEDITDKDGNTRKGLFLEAYLLHGDQYQSFTTPILNQNVCGHSLLMDLMHAHDVSEAMNGSFSESFADEMQTWAKIVEGELEELGLTNNQLVALRKRFKNFGVNYQPEYSNGKVAENKKFEKTDAVVIGKTQCQTLEELALARRNKQMNAQLTNSYINKDWIVSALNSTVPGRLSRQQRSLAYKVLKKGLGVSKSSVKKMIADGTLSEFLLDTDRKAKLETIAKGVDLGEAYSIVSKTGKSGDVKSSKIKKTSKRDFQPQYLVTDNYKLKVLKKPKKVLKTAMTFLPEFKKYAKRNQLFPITRWFFKHTGLGTYTSLLAGVAMIVGAVVTGLALPAAIALGAGGVALTGLTIGEKIQQKRTGKRLFGLIKTKQSKQLDEIRELQKNNPNKNVAPTASVTTANFRNKVIKSESKSTKNPFVKLKNAFKRFANNLGYNLSPKSDAVNFISYPKSFMEAYGDVSETTKTAINECLRKSIRRGLRENSDVRFLEKPVEIYIRDGKGKVVEAYHIDQKRLAKGVLEKLLEINKEEIEGQSKIVDINIGKTSFRINPAELNDTVDNQGKKVNGITRTVNDIVGYATEEQIVRHVNNMYKCVSDNPQQYGIVCKDGVVVGGQDFARIVNFNATRDSGEQVYPKFDFNGRAVPVADVEDLDTVVDVANEIASIAETPSDATGIATRSGVTPKSAVKVTPKKQAPAPVEFERSISMPRMPINDGELGQEQKSQLVQTASLNPPVQGDVEPDRGTPAFTLDDALKLRVTPHTDATSKSSNDTEWRRKLQALVDRFDRANSGRPTVDNNDVENIDSQNLVVDVSNGRYNVRLRESEVRNQQKQPEINTSIDELSLTETPQEDIIVPESDWEVIRERDIKISEAKHRDTEQRILESRGEIIDGKTGKITDSVTGEVIGQLEIDKKTQTQNQDRTAADVKEAMKELSVQNATGRDIEGSYYEFKPGTGNTQLCDQLKAALYSGELQPSENVSKQNANRSLSKIEEIMQQEQNKSDRPKSYSEALLNGEVQETISNDPSIETLEQKRARLEAELARMKNLKFTTLPDGRSEDSETTSTGLKTLREAVVTLLGDVTIIKNINKGSGKVLTIVGNNNSGDIVDVDVYTNDSDDLGQKAGDDCNKDGEKVTNPELKKTNTEPKKPLLLNPPPKKGGASVQPKVEEQPVEPESIEGENETPVTPTPEKKKTSPRPKKELTDEEKKVKERQDTLKNLTNLISSQAFDKQVEESRRALIGSIERRRNELDERFGGLKKSVKTVEKKTDKLKWWTRELLDSLYITGVPESENTIDNKTAIDLARDEYESRTTKDKQLESIRKRLKELGYSKQALDSIFTTDGMAKAFGKTSITVDDILKVLRDKDSLQNSKHIDKIDEEILKIAEQYGEELYRAKQRVR